MKIINLTIITAGQATGACLAGRLDAVPDVNVVALPSSLHEPGVWVALGLSDVLVLDEAAIAQGGAAVVQSIHAGYPALRTLLLVEHDRDDMVRAAFALGIHGMMRQPTPVNRLWQAIATLYGSPARITGEFCPSSGDGIEVDTYQSIPAAKGKLH